MMDQEDPEEERGPFSEQEQLDAMNLEVARWMNPEYQQNILGVPLNKYLEGEYFDSDSSFWSDPHHPQDFLSGETLEVYYGH